MPKPILGVLLNNYSKGNVAYADVLSSILPTSSCLSTTGTASTGCAH